MKNVFLGLVLIVIGSIGLVVMSHQSGVIGEFLVKLFPVLAVIGFFMLVIGGVATIISEFTA